MKNTAVFTIGVIILVFSITNCELDALRKDTLSVQEHRPLKYPVVLVHGISAHDRKGLIHFWGRIPTVLKDQGVQVFFGNTDAWGSYESNAAILKETIERVLIETNQEKVNIIAHSKGGIDSRYLIWRYDFGDKVASLTTVSTPHHGAEVADLIAAQEILYSKSIKHVLEVFGTLSGDENPDLYAVLYQLTTASMEAFNRRIPMDDRVYYQSLYSVMHNGFDDLLYFHTYSYIKKTTGPNDGLVSEKSTIWGNHSVKIVNQGISHSEIIDIKKKTIAGLDIPSLYIDIVHGLSGMGF